MKILLKYFHTLDRINYLNQLNSGNMISASIADVTYAASTLSTADNYNVGCLVPTRRKRSRSTTFGKCHTLYAPSINRKTHS